MVGYGVEWVYFWNATNFRGFVESGREIKFESPESRKGDRAYA